MRKEVELQLYSNLKDLMDDEEFLDSLYKEFPDCMLSTVDALNPIGFALNYEFVTGVEGNLREAVLKLKHWFDYRGIDVETTTIKVIHDEV